MAKGVTPSQTIGPFYWGTLVNAYSCDLAPPGVAGERIEVVLQLHDADGNIVPDGIFEVWQANSHGRYNHPDDPLLAYDPIYNSVPAGARERLQAAFDMDLTQPEWALGYHFDIVLRGRNATPME